MCDPVCTDLFDDLPPYVREVQEIGAVGQFLETVAALTGLGFVAVAHVTDHSWTTCAVLDKLGFGLKVGDGLDVTTTLCEEVRATACTIVIDHVQESDRYRDHHTPRIYGFQSYFSIPCSGLTARISARCAASIRSRPRCRRRPPYRRWSCLPSSSRSSWKSSGPTPWCKASC